jgi:heme-degrading monooxygenase HmoA
MFAVIYYFEVLPGKEKSFIEGWKGLTQFIYQYEGSLGSRLHKKSDGNYIAYAQWPDRKRWEESGKNLPPEAEVPRKKMKEACASIKTAHELEMIEDLLAESLF